MKRSKLNGAATTVLVLGMSSCDGEVPPAVERWTEGSEGGVSTAVYHGSVVDLPELTSVPRVAIGDVDGPSWATFGRIGAGELLDDGGFAVVDMQALRVHIYDAGGGHRSSVGRQGRGPGEFQTINGLGELADGLEVWDARQQRLTLFDANGEFAESVPAPDDQRLVSMASWEGGYLALALDAGSVEPPASTDFALNLTSAEVLGITDAGLTHLLRVPYLEAGHAIRDGNPVMVTLPFPHRGRIAANADGIVRVFSGSPEVFQYEVTGELSRRVRFPGFDRPLDEVVVDSMRDAALARVQTPELREIVGLGYSLPVPERMPTFDQIRVDDGVMVLGLHSVWERRGRQPWLFVSVDEQRIGVLWLGAGERILDVEGDRVLIAGASAAGVPRVTLHEVETWD